MADSTGEILFFDNIFSHELNEFNGWARSSDYLSRPFVKFVQFVAKNAWLRLRDAVPFVANLFTACLERLVPRSQGKASYHRAK
jgi:hypothetical protein